MLGMVLKRPRRVTDEPYVAARVRPEHNGRDLADRATRLAELAALIRAGAYNIPAEWVAEAILSWPGRAGRRN